jgi:phage tail-like protein
VARRPGIEEIAPASRPASSRGSNGLAPGPQSGSRLNEHLLSPAKRDPHRYGELPTERSTWLQYLPAIFSEPIMDFNGFNHNDFIGRYLMIFETVLNPVVWLIDNFDLYLSARTAPESWLTWLAGWFDVWLIPELPEARKRQIVEQLGWLYLRRGTAMGLSRFLELYFGVPVDIVEFDDLPCTFTVRIPLAHSDLPLTPAQKLDLARQLVDGQRPAFTRFEVEDISASI